jgi:hypothetical protein
MFVNCPDVGAVGTERNVAEEHESVLDALMASNWILGSDLSLIMQGGRAIDIYAGGDVIGTTMTNMMGAFEYELQSSGIPAGTTEILIKIKGDTSDLDATIRIIEVVNAPSVDNDYIDEAPPTFYELDPITPQNMDFDRENNMFPAHSGWYNDFEIHYYKFRMYTPSTLPGVITLGSASSDVPVQNVYMVTTTGGFDGVVGMPIVQYHHESPLEYSDFMEIVFVTAPANYMADEYRSEADVTGSGAVTTPSGIILNMPVVPTNSTLQHPETKGTTKAPIDHVPVWYMGVEVWTYVFEVTDQAAADFLSFTRPEDPADPAFAITVAPFAFTTASQRAVSAIQLWHVNQYTRGVTQGENSGGPSPAGMRNIINLDRGDAGYSPLWRIVWITSLPVNYEADDASNNNGVTNPQNGFDATITPMFINCPDIGLVGTEQNTEEEHESILDASQSSNWILGSDLSLIMQKGRAIEISVGDKVIGTTETNLMGAFEYELQSSDIPAGTTEIVVTIKDDKAIRIIEVVNAASPGDGPDDTSDASCLCVIRKSMLLVSFAVVFFVL